MSNKKVNIEMLKKQTIGVEIEMSKISKGDACKIVNDYYNTKNGTDNVTWYDGRHHQNWCCFDGQTDILGKKRVWQFMDDGSSSGDWGRITCEMVTPILTYDDIEDLQNIVRLLRQAGAKSGAHYNAGVHIHVGANFDQDGGCNAKTIRNLVNLIASHERLICDAVSVTPSRQAQWAHFVEPDFLRDLNTKKPKTKAQLGALWYGSIYEYNRVSNNPRECHYHHSRYHLLNLHALWDKNTIEFRCFEFHNNLHAGELKAWIQLCLAMVSYSKIVSYCSPNPVNTYGNTKYTCNSWLKNMGLIGTEFKTCRKMLLKHLHGDTAYRSGRPVRSDLEVIDDYAVDLMAD